MSTFSVADIERSIFFFPVGISVVSCYGADTRWCCASRFEREGQWLSHIFDFHLCLGAGQSLHFLQFLGEGGVWRNKEEAFQMQAEVANIGWCECHQLILSLFSWAFILPRTVFQQLSIFTATYMGSNSKCQELQCYIWGLYFHLGQFRCLAQLPCHPGCSSQTVSVTVLC